MKLACVIVIYNVPVANCSRVIMALGDEVEFFIVDNSDKSGYIKENLEYYDVAFKWNKSINYFSLKENKGIATAQNIALKLVVGSNHEAVLFLDDDTSLQPGFKESMLRCMEENLAKPFLIAIMPRVFSEKKEEIGNYRKEKGEYVCREMMNSGTLVPRKTLVEIGLMNETLFIDYVDFDFGWRLQAAGGKIIVCEDASIVHSLGETEFKFAGQRIFKSSAVRLYYQSRNIFLLLKKPYSPKIFLVKIFFKNAVKSFLQSISYKKTDYMLKFLKGTFNGIKQSFYFE
jgi:rhamnosyltransferase